MIISVNHDTIECNSVEDFEKIIKEQLFKESGEIWISLNGDRDEYPCLAVLVNKECACLNYFGVDGSCYSSYFNDSKRDIVYFCDSQYEVDSNQVISKESALKAIIDFYPNSNKSESIQWDQIY